MIRKMLLMAAAVVVPVSLLSASGVASASSGVVETTASVVCTGVSGTATFSPPITSNQKAGTQKIKFKATLSGCTASGNASVTISEGAVKGTISTTRTVGNGCRNLFGGTADVTGSLTIKWTSTPKIISGNSVVTVHTLSASIDTSNNNVEYQIPGTGGTASSGSGSFEGSDRGASDLIAVDSTLSYTGQEITCGDSRLKSIDLEPSGSGADPISLS